MKRFLLLLSVFLSGFYINTLSAQNKQTLTKALRSLARESGKIISFSQTLTDDCIVNVIENQDNNPVNIDNSLSVLLKNTDFQSKQINSRCYLVYKVRRSYIPDTIVTKEPEMIILPVRQPVYASGVVENKILRPVFSDKFQQIEIEEGISVSEPRAFNNHLAVKTNLIYLTFPAYNLGVEFRLFNKLTLDLSMSYSVWDSKYRSISHKFIQPELRYYLKKEMKGHFLGVNALIGEYDLKGLSAFGAMNKDSRYKGDIYAAGLVYGYSIRINRYISVEPVIGFGAGKIKFHDYPEQTKDRNTYNEKYIPVPTKLSVNIVYRIY